MFNFKRLGYATLMAGAVLTAGTMAARAGTLTVTSSYGPAATDWTGTGTSNNLGQLNVPLFNLAGQTLQQVDVTLSAHVVGSADLTISGGAVIASGFAGALGVYLVNPSENGDPNNIIGAFSPYLIFKDVNVAPVADGTYTANIHFSGVDISGSASTSITTGGSGFNNLGGWIGAGNQLFYLATINDILGTTSGGSFTFSQTTNADAGVTVTYTYTEAPEPASLVLLGVGLAGLGLARRRKA